MYQLHTVLLLILDTVTLVQRTLTFTYLNSAYDVHKYLNGGTEAPPA